MIKRMHTNHGFTLIEMVMVIVITGIIAGMVAIFIRAPVQGYFDMESRAGLTDAADTTLRRMGRDLHIALPNSIQVPAANRIGFIPTLTGGRYRAEGPGNVLNFSSAPANDFPFDVMGGMPASPSNGEPKVGDFVVVYNLGIPGANAYTGGNRATIVDVDNPVGTITLPANTLFPLESPGKRFHVISSAQRVVYYVCAGAGINNGNGTGTLCRYSNLAFNAAAPTNCQTGTPIMVDNVSSCNFSYAPINQRDGLVSLQLSLTRNNETVSLYHEAHINNVP